MVREQLNIFFGKCSAVPSALVLLAQGSGDKSQGYFRGVPSGTQNEQSFAHKRKTYSTVG
jgi:hypothetical protein